MGNRGGFGGGGMNMEDIFLNLVDIFMVAVGSKVSLEVEEEVELEETKVQT